jgi:hypothetical protein
MGESPCLMHRLDDQGGLIEQPSISQFLDERPTDELDVDSPHRADAQPKED